jgi:drug/metabolite transporter (DMT)-like permease
MSPVSPPSPRASPPSALSASALVAVVIWGASFVATRIALDGISPMALVAARTGLAAASLVAICLVRGVPLWRRGAAPWRESALLGSILAVHLAIQAVGLGRTTAINTAWIIGFIPVAVAIGAWLFLAQRLSAQGWLGVALGAAGVALVLLRTPPRFEGARAGDLLQLVSAFTWAAYTLLSARPTARHGSLVMTTAPMVAAAAFLLPVAAVEGHAIAAPLEARHVLALVFLAFVCSAFAYLMWFRALERIGPARTAAYIYIEPFVTLALARWLLGEPVTAFALAGGVTVLVGVWLVNRSRPVPPALTARRDSRSP